jgi:hypothetical protein
MGMEKFFLLLSSPLTQSTAGKCHCSKELLHHECNWVRGAEFKTLPPEVRSLRAISGGPVLLRCCTAYLIVTCSGLAIICFKNKTSFCIVLELKQQYESNVQIQTGRRRFDSQQRNKFWRVAKEVFKKCAHWFHHLCSYVTSWHNARAAEWVSWNLSLDSLTEVGLGIQILIKIGQE